MTERECDRLFHKILNRVGSLATGQMVRAALGIGINISTLDDQERRKPILNSMSQYYSSLNEKEKRRALRDVVKAVVRERPELDSELHRDIEGEGFLLVDDEFVRVDL